MPFTGSFALRGVGAAALAVERVNADKALLHGRRLEFSFADSGCSAQQGLAAMGKLLKASRVDAVIGLQHRVRGYELPCWGAGARSAQLGLYSFLPFQ